jgi:hypothetical protein
MIDPDRVLPDQPGFRGKIFGTFSRHLIAIGRIERNLSLSRESEIFAFTRSSVWVSAKTVPFFVARV